MAAMGARAGQPRPAAVAAVAALSGAGAEPLSAAERATIHYLARRRWTIAQITDYSGQDRATIVQVLREPAPAPVPVSAPVSAPAPATDPAAAALQVRLSRDARRLQIRLPVEAVPAPTAVLLEQIRAECACLHLPVAPTAADLDQRLETCVYGAWQTVLEAMPPTPPTPGRVTLLVPVPTAGRHAGGAALVRRGTVLARRVPGQPGQPGRDLRGRPLPPRLPREATLPQGEHTSVSADGTELVAACDGQVVLRHLRLHVRPTTLHEGDLTADDGVLQAPGAAIVTGAVRAGGAVAAQGDVEIRRGVQTGRIASATGSIVVEGAVVGAAAQPAVLHAGRDITCGRVRHGALRAHGDLVLHGDAHHSTLEVGGTLYLPAALEECLVDVRLAVGGGVVVPVAPPAPSVARATAPTERRHTRVLVTLPAQLARYGPPPFVFTPCLIEDLSPGGARCHLVAAASGENLAPDTLVQLKWELPESPGQVIAIARTVHTGAPDTIGVAFLQIAEHDADRVMQFCLSRCAHPRRTARGRAPIAGPPARRRMR